MKIKTIKDKNFKGKKVFLRVDYNVPIEKGVIIDDTRITATIPTIEYLLSQGSILILASHLGRPKGKPSPEFSLKPVAEKLSQIIKKDVKFVPDCIGDEVKRMVNSLKEGDILLLENLRFHPEEENGDENFAKELASLCDCYVNDAFGTCHREHASVYTITKFVNDVSAGFLIEKEVSALSKLLTNPEKPFLLILGGAKVADKIGVVKNLLDKVDTIITGGVMAYTFIKAKNWEVGDSKVEEEAVGLAKEIIKEVNKRHLEFHTPLDHVIVQKISEDAVPIITERGTVPHGWIGVDIGPQAIEEYTDCISRSKTIFWNGPMGIYEIEKFAKGTIEIAKAIGNSNAFSVIGGGDSAAAVNKANVADKISHVCTGGGASLEFLEKGTLPGIEVLKEK